MPAPWSEKGAKGAVVAADEFLILDSQDATPATQNKRVTMSALQIFSQTPWVQNIDAAGFNLTDVGNLGIGTTTPTEKVELTGGNFLQTALDASIIGGVKDTLLNGAVDVVIVGNYAYVTAASAQRLVILDITEPTAPIIISSITDTILDGINGVYVSGRYAYVVSSTADSFVVIDVSDPTTPVIEGTLQDSSRLNSVQSLYVSGRYAYVTASIDNSLQIIDVSDPTTPVFVGEIQDVTNLNGIVDVYVSGRYAYVTANTDDSLQIIDVSDPTTPVIVGTLQDSSRLNGAQKLYVSGRYAYVTATIDDSLQIIDVSDPTTPVFVGEIQDGTNLNGIVDVFVSGNYAYVVNAQGDSMRIIDVSDPTTPVIVGGVQDGTNLSVVMGVFVSGKYVYVVNQDDDSFRVIDVSGIMVPTATIGNIKSGYLSVTDNAVIANNLYSNGLNVGFAGIKSDGEVSFANDTITTMSGNVGIGTTTPASPLHIFESNTGDGSETGLTIEQDSTGDALLHFLLTDDAQTWTMGIDNSDSEKFKVASSVDLTSSTILTILTTGNVGIGTTTPASPLHIFEDTSGTDQTVGLTIQQDGIGDSLLHFFSEAQAWTIGVDASIDDEFKIASSTNLTTNTAFTIQANGDIVIGNITVDNITVDQITFDNQGGGGDPILLSNSTNQDLSLTGKLGIGITTPTSTLHIFEDNGQQGAIAGLTVEQAGGGDSLLHFILSAGTDVVWTMGIDNIDDSFRIAQSFALTSDTGLIIDSSNNITMNDITVDQITFDNQGGGGDPILLSNSTNQDLSLTGKLGIGTTTPTSLLHIFESDTGTSSGTGVTIQQDSTGDALLHFLRDTQNYTLGIDSSDSDNFKIARNSTLGSDTVLTIDSSSNVGIGTIIPTAKLSVQNSNTSLIHAVNTQTSSSLAGAGIVAYTDDGTAVSSGNRLGFFLLGGATDTISTLENTAGMVGFASENFSGSAEGSELAFEVTPNETTARIEAMRIDNAGNLGIGTTTPIATLSIEMAALLGITIKNTITGSPTQGTGIVSYTDDGAATSSGDRLGFYLMGGATDVSNTLANTAGIQAFASENFSGSAEGSELTFEVTPNGTTSILEAMRIDNAGNVGIGTATPETTLHVVNDTSTATNENGIQIEQQGTGDALLQFRITTFQRWIMGVDNSDDDKFKIAQSEDLDTNAVFTINPDTLNTGIGTIDPNSTLEVGGSLSLQGITVTGDTNTDNEVFIGVNSPATARTITIQTEDIVANRIFIIQDEGGAASSFNITITTQGGGNIINGAATTTIAANFGASRLRVNAAGTALFTW